VNAGAALVASVFTNRLKKTMRLDVIRRWFTPALLENRYTG